jgi:hypothetical protein
LNDRPSPAWQAAETAPDGVLILVCGPFGVATAQRGLGEFWAMAGELEAYTNEGDLLMLEGVTGWMMLAKLEHDPTVALPRRSVAGRCRP